MQEHDLLIHHIKQLVSINDSDIDLIIKLFKSKTLERKEILLHPGEIASHMTFIAKGCFRSYYLDDNVQEHILQFGIENWWINDLYSYLTKTPAKYFVQAVESSTVLQIHQDALEIVFKEIPVMERFFRLKMQSAYVSLQERTINSMSQTAEQRYIDFLARYREIEQRIPQYMVASYLGITPEFLSAIRKKMVL